MIRNIFSKLSGAYLLAVVFLCWGFFIGRYDFFPSSYIASFVTEIELFIQGSEEEETTLAKKIESTTVTPYARELESLVFSQNINEYEELELEGARKDVSMPLVYRGKKSYLPVAIMTRHRFGDDAPAVILLDERREHIHSWHLNQPPMNEAFDSPTGPWGFQVMDDGSLIYFRNGESGLFRIDICGELIWKIAGYFHHESSIDSDRLWLLGLPQNEISPEAWNHRDDFEIINEVDVTTGKLIRSIPIYDIVAANIDRFDPLIKRLADKYKVEDGMWMRSAIWHPNDAAVLPASMAHQFPLFQAGDVALSLKFLNLLLVFDPDTLKIKWFSQGYVQVQHDPDWQPNGLMTVYNNRDPSNNLNLPGAAENFTDIVAYNFKSESPTTLVRGVNYSAQSRHSGGHEISKNGDILLSLDLQGRLTEIDKDGTVQFEYNNRFNDAEAVRTRLARYVDLDKFKDKIGKCSK